MGRCSALQHFNHCAAESRGAFRHMDPCSSHRFHLRSRGIAAARYYLSCMSHAATGRRGCAGDEPDGGLLHGMSSEELRGIDFTLTANFANHDDLLGFVISQEHFEYFDEIGSLDRIATDAHAGTLAEANGSGLRHRFISESAGP